MTQDKDEILCPTCNCALFITVKIGIKAPSSMWHKFSKGNLRKKSVSLEYADWGSTKFYCPKGCPIPKDFIG